MCNKKRNVSPSFNLINFAIEIGIRSAWVLLRNQSYTVLFVSKQYNMQQTARLIAKTISNHLFRFTSVHLSAPELKIKKNIQIKQACIFHAANEKQHTNHETLLFINSL